MLYRKNLGSMQSRLRLIGGALVAGGGLYLAGTGPLGLALAAAGAGLAMTGLVGWCPACAMLGLGGPDAGGGRR